MSKMIADAKNKIHSHKVEYLDGRALGIHDRAVVVTHVVSNTAVSIWREVSEAQLEDIIREAINALFAKMAVGARDGIVRDYVAPIDVHPCELAQELEDLPEGLLKK